MRLLRLRISERKTLPSIEFMIKSTVIVILWATPPLVSKIWIGNEASFPAFFFGFLRYLLGFITLFVVLVTKGKIRIIIEIGVSKIREISICSSWLVLMIIGQNLSVLYILGSSSSILLNFNPIFVYIIAPVMFRDEAYSFRKTLAVILSTFGIILVFLAASELLTTDPGEFFLGNLLGLLSGVAWAGYSLSLKKLFRNTSSEAVTTLNLMVAALILLLLSLLFEEIPDSSVYYIESIAGLALIGVGAAAIAFTLYLQLIQTYGAIKAANIQFLIPLVSILFAWIFLAEFSLLALFGGILCAIGVALVTYSSDGERGE
jgi:drug/metabolite transporter (DMT)-like permease